MASNSKKVTKKGSKKSAKKTVKKTAPVKAVAAAKSEPSKGFFENILKKLGM
jgi:hypothetical protein